MSPRARDFILSGKEVRQLPCELRLSQKEEEGGPRGRGGEKRRKVLSLISLHCQDGLKRRAHTLSRGEYNALSGSVVTALKLFDQLLLLSATSIPTNNTDM